MAEEETITLIKRDFIRNLAKKGRRIDGRAFDDMRPITIETAVVSSAEGSARVKIGKSDVLAGIKMSMGTPFPDTPDKGVMTTNAEMVPMASPTFETGPPSQVSIEFARVVDRGIRESGCLPLESLCVKPGEKVWVIFIDMHVLDYDGNLFDTGSLAAVSALKSTRVPAKSQDMGEDFPLTLGNLPISVTTVKIGDALMVDPGLDEERVADARLTVSSDENHIVRAMQKGFTGAFKQQEVLDIVERAMAHGDEIRKKVIAIK